MAFFSPLFVVYYNFRVDGSAILNLRLRYKTILYLERVIVYSLKLRGWGSYVESGCQRNTGRSSPGLHFTGRPAGVAPTLPIRSLFYRKLPNTGDKKKSRQRGRLFDIPFNLLLFFCSRRAKVCGLNCSHFLPFKIKFTQILFL